MKPFKAEEKKILIDKARLLTVRTFLTLLTLLTCLHLPSPSSGKGRGKTGLGRLLCTPQSRGHSVSRSEPTSRPVSLGIFPAERGTTLRRLDPY